MGDSIHIILFLKLFPASGSESPLLAYIWKAIIGDSTVAYFSNTYSLMVQKNIKIVTGWDSAANHIESWDVFCVILLRDPEHYLPTMDIEYIIEETDGVSAQLQAQAQ